MSKLVVFSIGVLALSSCAYAECVYEGKSYSLGAVVCVPNTGISLTCMEPQASKFVWLRTDPDVHCLPGACVNSGRVYSEGGVYTRKDTNIRCKGGKWVPN
jgi:hypothetical protein